MTVGQLEQFKKYFRKLLLFASVLCQYSKPSHRSEHRVFRHIILLEIYGLMRTKQLWLAAVMKEYFSSTLRPFSTMRRMDSVEVEATSTFVRLCQFIVSQSWKILPIISPSLHTPTTLVRAAEGKLIWAKIVFSTMKWKGFLAFPFHHHFR